MFSFSSAPCSSYWNASDWLPLTVLLKHWCHGKPNCWEPKWFALISACERGEVEYRRSDGKDYDDAPTELARRNVLLIGRKSFDAWTARAENGRPIGSPTIVAQNPAPPWLSAKTAPTAFPQAQELQSLTVLPKAAVRAVPSELIINVFPVMTDPSENLIWWKTRMRNAKDYQLDGARISAGRLKQSSMWDPGLVAVWLHEKHHLKLVTLKRIMDREFPDRADVLDYLASK